MGYIFLLLILQLYLTLSNAQSTLNENNAHNTVRNFTEHKTPLMLETSLQNNNKKSADLQGRPSASINPEAVQILALINLETTLMATSPDGTTLLLFDPLENCYQIYNVMDPSSPTNVSSVPMSLRGDQGVAAVFSPNSKIIFTSNYHDLSDGSDTGELFIIDISDLLAPTIIASYVTPASTALMALSSDARTLFLASDDFPADIIILNVSNLTAPRNISGISVEIRTIGMELSADGSRLFVMDLMYLYIYDVSYPESPIYLNKIMLPDPLALGISQNGNTAFVVNSDYGQSTGSRLEIIDTSDPHSLHIISSLDLETYHPDQVHIAVSPDSSALFLTGFEAVMIVNLLNLTQPTYRIADSLQLPDTIVLSSDGKYAFLTNDYQVIITELFLNVQIGPVFDLKPEIILNKASDQQLLTMIMSSDTKTAFIVNENSLEILNLSNLTAPMMLSNYTFDGYELCYSIVLSHDENTVFVGCDGDFIVLNVSNLTAPYNLSLIPAYWDTSSRFSISSDDQIGFLSIKNSLYIINISNLSSPSNISVSHQPKDWNIYSLALSQDSKTMFLLLSPDGEYYNNSRLEIADLSNLTSPVTLSFTEIIAGNRYNPAIALSPDDSYVILIYDTLVIYDVSNRTTPTQVVWSDVMVTDPRVLTFSDDMRTLSVATRSSLFIIDLPAMTLPRLLRSYSIGNITNLALSPDKSTLFCGIYDGPFIILGIRPEYTLYMRNSHIELGQISSNNLLPLQLNSVGQFDLINEKFSFLQVSLYSITSIPDTQITYPALPNWIVFDQAQGALTFAPNSAAHIGSYQIYATLSVRIPDDAFVNITTNITNVTQSLDLIASLISMGYIDPEQFLTAYFSPNKKLFLTSEYAPYASEIQTKMLEYYIETVTSVSIEFSISLNFLDKLSVTTISQNTLRVIIKSNQNQIQFAKKNYAALTTISADKTTIIMQGSLVDINTALDEIFINIANETKSFSGSITVSDSLNPVLTLPITNMSNYFWVFEPPYLSPNFSIQTQVDQTPIYTGQQFMIDISDMFSDQNGQDLVYSLTMQDSSQQVPEWLMLRDTTLIGTPPDQFTQNEFNLIITAANEFKSTSQAFKINIKISVLYGLSLVGTYGGALITVIGLWIYIYSFYNILFKTRYRYPKDFVIKVGDEKSIQKVCGIAFIAKEMKASQIIWNKMRKTVLKRSNQLDESEIVSWIKKERVKMEDHRGVKGHLRWELVNQLIINQFVRTQLNLENEKLTKRIFNKIKDGWANLIEKSENEIINFQISKDKLYKRLQTLGIHSYKPSISQETNILGPESLLIASKRSPISFPASNKNDDSFELNDKSNPLTNLLENDSKVANNNSSQVNLINPTRKTKRKITPLSINFELLEKAIIAHTFAYHYLDVNRADVKVVVSLKVSNRIPLYNIIKLFFKRDLERIEFVGGSDTLYGMRFTIEDDALCLSGAPESALKNETLVVQIVNRRGKILRELWLRCIASDVELMKVSI